jgi:hypothetical protein
LQSPWNPERIGLIDDIFKRRDRVNYPQKRDNKTSTGQTTHQATVTYYPDQIALFK